MKLPQDDMDGSLSKERVLLVLSMHGVSIQNSCGMSFMTKGDILEAQMLTEQVPRKLIRDLARRFEIDFFDFYHHNGKLN